MAIHRLKRGFTAGEISPLMMAQVENDRYKTGCRQLKNMVIHPQGPTSRREGFLFLYDLTTLLTSGLVGDTIPRFVPFIFSRTQRYVLAFYPFGSVVRVAFVTRAGLVEDPDSPGDPYIYEFTGVFDIDNFKYAQSADILYIVQSGRTPIEFKRLAHDEWSANEIVFTSMPSDWNSTDGFPEFVDFFEQRMVYASTTERPQTLWFSKSGDFYDFGVSSPIVASDAVTLTMDSGTQNKIQWTSTGKQLLVGTLGDEWAISGSGYEPLSFTSNRTARHTNIGGERLEAMMIGPATIFLELHGRRVNQFVFDFNADSYDAVDLSVLAPHLTDEYSVTRWTYQQTPMGVIWCVREDGQMISFTYKREHKVTGWHIHDTEGLFLDVCSIPGDREDDVFVLVEREVEGVKKWYIEVKQPEFKSDDAVDSYFLDSHLIYDGTAVDTISGLDHLEGMTVSVLADGGVLADKVVASGAISLEVSASKVIVGLAYESIVEPVLPDMQLVDGSTYGRVVRITKADILLYRSLLFEYGKFSDGEWKFEEEPFRYPVDITGVQVPLFTGVKEVDFFEGYGQYPRLAVRQRKPLPMTVIAIVDHMEVYG
jgi:hypothetical protein